MNRVLVPLALSPTALSACNEAARIEALGGLTMGTSWSVRLVPPDDVVPGAIADAVQQSLDQVISEMSHWEATSQLSRFNNAVADEWRDLPTAFFKVLDCALSVAAMTGGAYDPTVGPLVDLWGFGPAPTRTAPPAPAEITAAQARVGWRRITLDREDRRARQPGGCRLDFSALAKGFAVDHAAAALRRLGARHFLVEVGGELRGEGVKPDGTPWWVALERPPSLAANDGVETLVALHGLSVATSGDYQRCFESGGQSYSHSIDPRSGYPVANGVMSVSVIHPSCMLADVHATALTVMGADAGMAFAEAHDLAALMILRDGDNVTERLSPALSAMLA